jgi:hypothetical protein
MPRALPPVPAVRAGFNLNERHSDLSPGPLAVLRMVVSRVTDPAPHLAACEALVRGGAHLALGRDCTNLAGSAIAYEAAKYVTRLRLQDGAEYVAKREETLNARFLAGVLMLGDGLLLDATLRGQLGAGESGSPHGAWAWYTQRMLDDHPALFPGGKPPTSWPGAAIVLSGIVSGVSFQLDEWYRPIDYESAPEEQTKRAYGPGLVAWMWGRALEAAVLPAARHASWTRRRAAVVAAVWADEE